jgi:hypothetical protein
LSSTGWFRIPYRDGLTDPGINCDLALRGYYLNVDWTYDTTGWRGVSTSVIVDRVHRLTVPGAILLMHIGTGSTDPQALPSIISTLRSMGYGFTNPYRTLTTNAIRSRYVVLDERTARIGPPRTTEMVASTTCSTHGYPRTCGPNLTSAAACSASPTTRASPRADCPTRPIWTSRSGRATTDRATTLAFIPSPDRDARAARGRRTHDHRTDAAPLPDRYRAAVAPPARLTLLNTAVMGCWTALN